MKKKINEMNSIRFSYLKDPDDPRRVLTIGYMSVCGCEPRFGICCKTIVFQFATNKVVEKSTTKLDDRLRLIMTKEMFDEIQNKFRKRFGGDQHSKKQAKNVIIGRLRKGIYHIMSTFENHQKSTLYLILEEIMKNPMNYDVGVQYIAKYYFDNFYNK